MWDGISWALGLSLPVLDKAPKQNSLSMTSEGFVKRDKQFLDSLMEFFTLIFLSKNNTVILYLILKTK